MSSQVFLYKQLDENLISKTGFEFPLPTISYVDSMNNTKDIILDDSFVYNINEFDSSWSPLDNELVLNQSIIINNPKVLFGSEGLTARENELAIVVKIHSKTSNFSKNLILETFDVNSKKLNIEYTETFLPNMLKGIIYLEYYLVVSKLNESDHFQANQTGMQLSQSPLISYSISVDGDGSEFPIEEIHEPGKGLWRIWMDWVDIYSDTFDSSNVKLLLNNAHPLYDRLYKTNYRVNQYILNNIIVSAIILIIQKAVIIEGNEISEDMDADPSSIAKAIWYWISSFNIKTDSLESISNSAHANLDQFVEE